MYTIGAYPSVAYDRKLHVSEHISRYASIVGDSGDTWPVRKRHNYNIAKF